ncbi:MAG TPA: helix-turn-helix transcriptional regulator [Bacillaceae bacterium]
MFRSNIGKLIEESGLRKSFIAKKLEVNYRQLRNYETGHTPIPIYKAFMLADLLKVKVDDLYERVNEDKSDCENDPVNE